MLILEPEIAKEIQRGYVEEKTRGQRGPTESLEKKWRFALSL